MHIEVHAKYYVHIINTNYIHYYMKRVNLKLHLFNNLSIQKNIEKSQEKYKKKIEHKV